MLDSVYKLQYCYSNAYLTEYDYEFRFINRVCRPNNLNAYLRRLHCSWCEVMLYG